MNATMTKSTKDNTAVNAVRHGSKAKVYPSTPEPFRRKSLIRLLRVAICLHQRAYTSIEIAEKFSVDRRTALRDIHTLENAGFPIYRDEFRYRLERHFLKGML